MNYSTGNITDFGGVAKSGSTVHNGIERKTHYMAEVEEY